MNTLCLLSLLLLAILIVLAAAETGGKNCASDSHCGSSLLFCAANKCKQKYEGFCVRREDCTKEQICAVSAQHERGLCVKNVYKAFNDKIRTVVSYAEDGQKLEIIEPLTQEELQQFPIPYESSHEAELECAADHSLHSHDIGFKRNSTKPNGWEDCAKSTCDNPTERNKFTTTDRKTFLLDWIVMVDNDFSNEARTRIATATALLNDYWSSTGYSFKSRMKTYDTVYATYVVTHGACDPTTPPVKCIPVFDLIAKLVSDWKTKNAFQVVPVKPQSETLAGAAYFPWDQSKHGLILMNKIAVGSGYSTLAHELGHAFGLRHTFAGINEVSGCSSPCYEGTASNEAGDFCSDTAPIPRAQVCAIPSVETYPDPCNSSRKSWAEAPYKNLMSYGSCRQEFTSQQIKRMRCYVSKEFKRKLYE